MDHRVSIKLTKAQKQEIVKAINTKSNLTLSIKPRQILEGHDMLMLTKRQASQIFNGMMKKEVVELIFTKTQIQKMSQQIGSGILDSLSNMFNTAKSYVSSGVNKVTNYFKPKAAPQNTEMQNYAGLKNTKNSKAQQFFDDNANRRNIKSPVLSPFDLVKMDRPDIKAVKAVKPSGSVPATSKPTFDYKPMTDHVRIKTIKNAPLTGTERAIADWKLQKLGIPKRSIGDDISAGLDSIQQKYNDFTF